MTAERVTSSSTKIDSLPPAPAVNKPSHSNRASTATLKAAAAGASFTLRRPQPKGQGLRNFLQRNQFVLGLGATLLAITGILLFLQFTPKRIPDLVQVNDRKVITAVNGRSNFAASAFPELKGWTLGDVREYLGHAHWSRRAFYLPACASDKASVPEDFDAREQWPECFYDPLFTGNCSSSWAVTAADVLSSRLCISNTAKYTGTRISAQYLLSCNDYDSGCRGGNIDSAFVMAQEEGVYTEECFPYTGSYNVPCGRRCRQEKAIDVEGVCRLEGARAIKEEIVKNGPVAVTIVVHDDFLIYQNGVYEPTPSSLKLMEDETQPLTLAVTLVGWGKEDGRYYWIAKNTFGSSWGEEGYFKIVRKNNLVLTKVAIAAKIPARPKAIKSSAATTTLAPPAANLDEQSPSAEDQAAELNDSTTIAPEVTVPLPAGFEEDIAIDDLEKAAEEL